MTSILNAQMTVEELNVIYSYNLAGNVTWPNESRLRTFKVTLFGGTRKLKETFSKKLSRDRLKNVRIEFRQIDKLVDLKTPQVLFVASTSHDQIPQIFEKIEGKPVLCPRRLILEELTA